MKKLTLLTAASLFLFSAYSQNDSTRLDVGGVVLKRAFTQNVSIRGEDLEKMPFATLSEAISVWLYGSYTNPGYITYVVDGNVVSEVNAYSIHDIKEVVLVQNAAALNSLSTGQPQMIVITTRKGTGKSGIQAAAQTFVVSSPGSTTHLYHQYYAGAYKNLDKISFGLSANYLRDADPLVKAAGLHVITPYHLERWRLNGYFTWRPDSRNTVEVHAGFTPQTIGEEANHTLGTNPYDYHLKAHNHTNLFQPWARWHAEWSPGLRNDLQVGFITSRLKGDNWYLYMPVDTNYYNQYSESDLRYRGDHIYVRERVSYQVQAAGWSIEPSLNASYEHFKYSYAQASINATGRDVGPGNTNLGNIINTSSYGMGISSHLYLLTPAVDLSYKQVFNLQGGVMANVTGAKGQQGLKRIFPFVSTTVDLLRLGSTHQSGSSLKLFGSYAQRGGFVLNDYMLGDVSGSSNTFVNAPVLTGGYWTGTPVTIYGSTVKTVWVWQTGASYTSKGSRWQLSYNFERLNFPALGQWIATPGNGPSYVYSEWKSSRHFLGLQVRLVDKGAFSWRSGLTTTVIRNKANVYADTYTYPPAGDLAPDNKHPSWTGGWTNRIQCKDLSFGVDMVYHFSREVASVIPGGAVTYRRANTFLLQNIYVGYKLHLPGKTGLEIYADSRGLVRSSDKYNVMDGRRYYGVGGKITM